MGSGSSSSYSGAGGSQPFAEKYHVVSKELRKDKLDPDIYSPQTGYFKNPTATIIDSESSLVLLEGKKANGRFTYVLDENGNIIVGKRSNPNNPTKRAPHPTLIGGKDPQVQVAGIITIKNGKISAVDNQSGHFRPNIQSMEKVDAALQKICNSTPHLFDKTSKWRKNNDTRRNN